METATEAQRVSPWVGSMENQMVVLRDSSMDALRAGAKVQQMADLTAL
jgi:hypothetical protein